MGFVAEAKAWLAKVADRLDREEEAARLRTIKAMANVPPKQSGQVPGFIGGSVGEIRQTPRQVLGNVGGRDWDRTSDPCDVNAVASSKTRRNPRKSA